MGKEVGKNNNRGSLSQITEVENMSAMHEIKAWQDGRRKEEGPTPPVPQGVP